MAMAQEARKPIFMLKPADGAIGAFDGIGKSMWKLVANPVGAIILAIVAALALLYKSFTNSFEGGQKMEQIFAGIKAAGQALIDNIEKIAGAIIKLMKFDFSGAINDIKGVAKEAGAAYEAMAKLTKDAQKLHQEQLANDLDQAERAKKLAILREQATDETIPIAKRKAALQDLKRDAMVLMRSIYRANKAQNKKEKQRILWDVDNWLQRFGYKQ